MAEIVDNAGRVTYVPQTRQLVVTRPFHKDDPARKATDMLVGGSSSGRVAGSGNTYNILTRTPTPPPATTSGGAPKAGTTSGGGGGGTSGPSAAEQAAAAAAAAARAAANSAARGGATSDIDRFNAQIAALLAKKATNDNAADALQKLVGGGHAKVRDNALAGLDQALRTKLGQLSATFEGAADDFRGNLRDNEKSEHDASFSNLVNRAREKGDVVTQALSQGAGESDVLKVQAQALRNWQANQGDVVRSFFDTRSSINAGITDLNASTKTGMINEESSTNAAKGQRWDEFYDTMSDSYTNLANLDQNNYLLSEEIKANERQKGSAQSLLSWIDAGKDAASYKAQATVSSTPGKFTSQYASKAAEMASSSWKDPGVSKATQDWKGAAQSEGTLNSTQAWNAVTNEGVDGTRKKKRPEGATLRRW